MRLVSTSLLMSLVAACVMALLSPSANAAERGAKARELREACATNPQHAVCQALQDKRDKAKAKREAALDAAIQRVKNNR